MAALKLNVGDCHAELLGVGGGSHFDLLACHRLTDTRYGMVQGQEFEGCERRGCKVYDLFYQSVGNGIRSLKDARTTASAFAGQSLATLAADRSLGMAAPFAVPHAFAGNSLV
jgi:hypothetical protein